MTDPLMRRLHALGISPLQHFVSVLEAGGVEALEELRRAHPEVVRAACIALAPAWWQLHDFGLAGPLVRGGLGAPDVDE